MRVNATVTRLEKNFAVVESERLSACEGCHKHAEGCSVCSLMGPNKKISAKAKNTVGAKLGDTVEIETQTKTVMFYSFLVFVLPIAVMLAFYGIASALWLSELWRCLTSIGGFVLTFIFLLVYSKFRVENKCDAEIIKIIERKENID